MGFLKGCLKAVGTAALVATGGASTILKGASDAIGLEIGSELFGAAKDASFNGIREIWGSEGCDEIMDKADHVSYNVEDGVRKNMANTAYRAAQIAKKNGDMEKYEMYMEKYESMK